MHLHYLGLIYNFTLFLELKNKNNIIKNKNKKYLELTKPLRQSDSLFVSVRKPYKAVSAETVGRWLKSVLSEAGINTEIFKAHSTRAASVSKAFSKGVDIEFIKRTAGWTPNSRVFATFYNVPIISDIKNNVASAILN